MRRDHTGMLNALVVDDSELIRTRLVSRLRAIEGVVDVFTAEDLSQALDCVRKSPPSLILLDLLLPDGNALQYLPELRRLSPETLIVVLSNDANGYNRDRCRQAGAAAFFDKSIEFELALDWIARRIAQRAQIKHSDRHKKDASP